ncbi:MAG: glucose-1-phosphate adenylyltransferase subunit GlgD [Oscillospiraceae bacterium]|nr:glucose-1-phosphate adenylyltransferase subunit GlgD [Candidatus Ruminococcus equi]
MGSNKILGLIFANTNEKHLPDLTSQRTMGSVPFGGKYRIIDFPLSNMSNSGINNVGIIAKSNFHSLMDHLGSGSAWDLARRRSGLSILPPYGEHDFSNLIETFSNLHGYIEHGDEEYVLISPSDCIMNIDYSKVLAFHEEKDADVTFVYTKKRIDHIQSDFRSILELDSESRITKIMVSPVTNDEYNLTTGSILMKKDFLMAAVKKCIAECRYDFIKDIFQPNISKYKLYGYESTGYCEFITSVKAYFDANMKLMDNDIRDELFNPQRPIYTKVRDDIPCKYGLESSVKNSLIAQGCIINGTVENSIISKGVYVGKNTIVKNSIIMQDTVISDNSILSYVVIDKDVTIKEGRQIQGCDSYPMYISKKSIV